MAVDRRRAPAWGAALLALAVLGCTRSEPAVSQDVEAYLGVLRDIAPTEAETGRTVERILKTHFVDQADVRREIAGIRPRIPPVLERLRAYHPRTEPVARVHARYVAAWEGLLDGFEAVLRGFDDGDQTELARGREAITAWGRAVFETAVALRALRNGQDAPVRTTGP